MIRTNKFHFRWVFIRNKTYSQFEAYRPVPTEDGNRNTVSEVNRPELSITWWWIQRLYSCFKIQRFLVWTGDYSAGKILFPTQYMSWETHSFIPLIKYRLVTIQKEDLYIYYYNKINSVKNYKQNKEILSMRFILLVSDIHEGLHHLNKDLLGNNEVKIKLTTKNIP